MGRILLVVRLAVRDLRRRPTEAALLLLAILASTTTLTLGLVLRDAAGDPYESTRAATRGPDVVAHVGSSAGLPGLEKLAATPGVADRGGPYPVITGKLVAAGRTSDAQVVGRDATVAAVDQPKVTRGGWVRDGGVVLEAAFADSLKVRVGDSLTLGGRSFEVAGVAVSAAMAPYPGSSCIVTVGCVNGEIPQDKKLPPELLHNPGLVWLTQADVRELAPTPDSTSYVLNLKLTDPDEAQAFIDASGGFRGGLTDWRTILADATELAADSQILLLIGAWLLGLLGIASLSVLVGGRMADQHRRVGLLKAIGGTPGLVAAVLLAEYLLVAGVAAAAGLAIGALSAPLLTESSAGLVGGAGTASLTWFTVGLVTAVALGVAAVATAIPALRGARSSTVDALAGAARTPSRTGWLVALSRRVPVPLLLALRIAARRPRRVLLGMVSIAVTVSGLYILLVLNDFLGGQSGTGAYTEAQVSVLRHVLGVWTVILLSLAAVNVIVVTWATVLDNRHASALTRALGATPRQVSVALATAQVLPALVGAMLGCFPGGFALFAAINAIVGGDGDRATLPALWQLLALAVTTVLVVTALTAVPSHLGGRRPVAETL